MGFTKLSNAENKSWFIILIHAVILKVHAMLEHLFGTSSTQQLSSTFSSLLIMFFQTTSGAVFLSLDPALITIKTGTSALVLTPHLLLLWIITLKSP